MGEALNYMRQRDKIILVIFQEEKKNMEGKGAGVKLASHRARRRSSGVKVPLRFPAVRPPLESEEPNSGFSPVCSGWQTE